MTRDSETVAPAMNDPVSDADVFTTARLIARHWALDDIPAAHEISRHAAVTRVLGVEPHPDADATRSALPQLMGGRRAGHRCHRRVRPFGAAARLR